MNKVKPIQVCESYDWIEVISDESRYNEKNTIMSTQLEQLQNKWIELGLDTKCILWGNNKFKFINYVGYIQVDNVAIEILPKVTLNNDFHQMRKTLIEMINICYDLDILVDFSPNQLEQGDLKEILASYFSSILVKELHRGISQEYQLVEDNMPSLKGQLQIARHIRENISQNRPHLVSVCYEERIDNHALNQVLKSTSRYLMKTVRSFETKRKLQQIDYLLDNVQVRPFLPVELNAIHLNRTNKRFKKPFKLAKQFLLNETNTMQYNELTETFVILFKMNDLFETYIATLIEEISEKNVYIQDQRHRLFKNEKTERDIFQLKPDIVIGDTNQIIIDTKWKQVYEKEEVNRSGVTREDMYQMYAYLTRYKNAARGILLYPKTFESAGSDLYLQSWKVEGEEKLLRVYMVSLINRYETETELKKILKNIM